MNKKKAGLVSAGVLTALVAASPLAWAVGPSQQAPENCSFSANGGPAVEPPALPALPVPVNVVPQVSSEGDNVGHFGECSTFNNNNGEGNGLGNTLNGKELPAPSVPDLPLPGGVPSIPQLPVG
ncbi:hypothetical protein EV378_0507 [Pseudonocardia endophytica]|uniref:Small secreted domain DUF320 n=2 Tax=Pseudonocardia endophytica TaxID=401976 RepID=A0A4R1HQ59_PSEEN|nr:hypothetical protein EV378_0507 [Pseudonocardia endophytica]